MSEDTIVGTTKISDRWRMSLVKGVREEFAELDEPPEIGDRVAFKRRGDAIVIDPQ